MTSNKKLNPNHLTIGRTVVMNSSTYLLKNHGGPSIMELFQGRRIKKEAYENMYYMQSLSLQHNRYLCDNTYLSNPKKTYSTSRPLI